MIKINHIISDSTRGTMDTGATTCEHRRKSSKVRTVWRKKATVVKFGMLWTVATPKRGGS